MRWTSLGEAEARCGVALSPFQKDQISLYLELLLKWNQHISLTTVTDVEELLRFHFLESFWAASTLLPPDSLSICDIGSGAGFPGMVFKLARPDLKVALIERNHKKAAFLTAVKVKLGLDVDIHRLSAEDFPFRERIDLACMRAVRPLPRLLEPLVEPGIQLLYFRGLDSEIPPSPWSLVRELRFPLSQNRWASLYTT